MDYEQRRVRHYERRLGLVQEDVEAGSVDEVDFGFAPFGVGERRTDRKLPLDFLLVVIGHGGAVIHFAQPIHHARRVEQGGDQLGLTRVAVTDQGDIANVLAFVNFHCKLPLRPELTPETLGRRATRSGR